MQRFSTLCTLEILSVMQYFSFKKISKVCDWIVGTQCELLRYCFSCHVYFIPETCLWYFSFEIYINILDINIIINLTLRFSYNITYMGKSLKSNQLWQPVRDSNYFHIINSFSIGFIHVWFNLLHELIDAAYYWSYLACGKLVIHTSRGTSIIIQVG